MKSKILQEYQENFAKQKNSQESALKIHSKNQKKMDYPKSSEIKIMNFFSCLADETRLRIILSMAEKPKTVNEIYDAVGREKMTLSAISHQLKLLNNLNIVSYNKKGKEKFFELSDKFCWCILRDAFKQFGDNIKIECKKCGNKIRGGDKN